jgi:hypothetical protein
MKTHTHTSNIRRSQVAKMYSERNENRQTAELIIFYFQARVGPLFALKYIYLTTFYSFVIFY